jgi:hypothetical protein
MLLDLGTLLAAFASGCNSDSGDPCSGVDCSSRGFCVAEQGTAYCACISGFHPVALTCVPIDTEDPCLGVECSGHGSCRAVAEGPTCDCATGYRHVIGPLCEGMECDLFCIPIRPTDGDVVDAPEEAPDDATDESVLLPCEATFSYPTFFCDGAQRYVYGNAASAEAYCREEGFETGELVSGHRTDNAVCLWSESSWSAYDSEENPAVGRVTCTRPEPCAP